MLKGSRKYYALAIAAGFASPFIYNWTQNKEKSRHYPYILVGGGTASYFAAQTIRARDKDAKVVIIGDENEMPYNRAKLSKVLTPEEWERVPYEVDGFYAAVANLPSMKHGGVSLMRNTRVARIDAKTREVVLDNGERIGFDKCLLATGSRSKTQWTFDDDGHESEKHVKTAREQGTLIDNFRTIQDRKRLDSLLNANPSQRIAIVGGGLLGCELANSLSRRGGGPDEKRPSIKLIIPESHVLEPIVPKEVALDVEKQLAATGVELLPESRVTSFRLNSSSPSKEGGATLQIEQRAPSDGGESTTRKSLVFDQVIVAGEAVPNGRVAVDSGFKIDKDNGGVWADSRMHVKDRVWAAGDVCSFYDPQLDYQRFTTGWEHAQTTGRVAGENMTNGNKEYSHQAAFQSILDDKIYLTWVGDVNAQKHRVFMIRAKEESPSDETRAVVLYLDKSNERVKGALLYNVFGKGLDVARKLIADKQPQKDPTETAKLFDLTTTPGADDGAAEEN